MNGFKRLCLVVFALAGLFSLAALALTWFGPWTEAATVLLSLDAYVVVLVVCMAVTLLGLLVELFRGLFSRRVRTVEVAVVDGGSITVTREAIASQASHIVEADGTCTASRVRVDAKPRGHVRVFVRVLPAESLDVIAKGAELHEELVQGLAAVCGDKLEDVSLEFVEPRTVQALSGEPDYDYEYELAEDAATEPDAASAAAAPVEPDEDEPAQIRIPMGGTHPTERED